MASTKWIAFLFLTAAIGVAPAQAPEGPAGNGVPEAARPGGLTLAVIDLDRILSAYPRAIRGSQELDKLKAGRKAELEEDQRKIRTEELLLENYKPGTEREFLELKIQTMINTLQGKARIYEDELRRRRQTFFSAMLVDVQAAVRKAAEERRIDVVLRKHEDLGAGTSDAIDFQTRVVWYAAERFDLSPAVIKILEVMPAEGFAPDGLKADGAKADGAKAEGAGKPDGQDP